MSTNWQILEKKHQQLSLQLQDPSLEAAKRNEIQKEIFHVTKLLERYKEVVRLESLLTETTSQGKEAEDQEMIELFELEITDIEKQLQIAQSELDNLLYPPNPHNSRSVFLEIRAGAGGKEAALFAGDLLKMYTNYALSRNWKTAIESMNQTDLKGIKEVILHIKGKGVFGELKNESGVHRVQRVPKTETAGRVHTSTATVAVLPEAKEVDVTINPADLRIDVFRASGAGGQHVNTTDSAVRITHVPTGVVVSCQEERSQHKNKAKAMKRLQSRILLAQMEKSQKEMAQKRKKLVGSGERSEKVRTYNFPQNRVTDHQVNLTLKKLDHVMEGDLTEIIQALLEKDRQERKEQALT